MLKLKTKIPISFSKYAKNNMKRNTMQRVSQDLPYLGWDL